MSVDYKKFITEYKIGTIDQLHQLFWDHISSEWVAIYCEQFVKHGEITQQNFFGFTFIIDHIWLDVEASDLSKELPDTRVLGFFGSSNTAINKTNRSRMQMGWGKTSEAFARYGDNYDKGHFIAHGFGGPVDVNIFPQRHDINRGWSVEGKIYRKMERHVAANPGTFVFSRPIYDDLTPCPRQLEYGYFDADMNLHVEVFPNK